MIINNNYATTAATHTASHTSNAANVPTQTPAPKAADIAAELYISDEARALYDSLKQLPNSFQDRKWFHTVENSVIISKDTDMGEYEILHNRYHVNFLHSEDVDSYHWMNSDFQNYFAIKLTEAGVFEDKREAADMLNAMRLVGCLQGRHNDPASIPLQSTLEERVILREAVMNMAKDMAQYLDEEDSSHFLKQINSMLKGAEMIEQGYEAVYFLNFDNLPNNIAYVDVGDSQCVYMRPSDRTGTKEGAILFQQAAASDEENTIYQKLKSGEKLNAKDMDYLLSLFREYTLPLINSAFASGYSAMFESLLKADERTEADEYWFIDKVERSLQAKYEIGKHQNEYRNGIFSPNNPYVKMAAAFDANARSIAEQQAAIKEKYQADIATLTNELKTSQGSLANMLKATSGLI
ncbi:MAG: hypothetical protein FWG91_10490 [Lachnospiraceae bacterium]|nr:hypothetical protein [Lachnospiraceae bacterium]